MGVFHWEKMLSRTWGPRVLHPHVQRFRTTLATIARAGPARPGQRLSLWSQRLSLWSQAHSVPPRGTGAARFGPAVIVSACYTEMN